MNLALSTPVHHTDYESAQELCRAGRFHEAARALKQRHGIAGDSPWVLGAMAMVCREQGAYEEALSWADLAIRFGLHAGIGQAEAGFALLALGRFDDAIPVLSQAMRFEEAFSAVTRLRLAEATFDRGEPAEAFGYLEGGIWCEALEQDAVALAHACMALNPSLRLPTAWIDRWTAADQARYGRVGAAALIRAVSIRRWDEAQLIGQRLLRFTPEHPDSLLAIGIWRFHQERFEEADRLFGEAGFRKPTEQNLLGLFRGLLSYRLHRFPEAVRKLEDVFDRLSTPHRAILADCYRRLGQKDKARELAQECLNEDPASAIARSVLWRLSAESEKAAALDDARELLAQDPGSAPAYYFLADDLWASNPAAAIAVARRAMKTEPLLADAADWADRLERKPRTAGGESALSLVGLYAPKPGEGSAWPTPEQTELLRVALEPDVDVRAGWDRWCEGRDIQNLDAGLYRLLPLLYRRLAEQRETGAPHFQLLAGIWRKMHYENYNRWRKIFPAIDCMLGAGIRVMPLKGGLLGEGLYGDWGSRPMADVDLLVPLDQAGRADRLLREAGLAPVSRFSEERIRLHYSLTYKEPSGSSLDLHWRPMEEMVLPAYSDDVVWADSEPMILFGRAFMKPSPTFQIVHAVVHGLRWNDVAPVRWVSDAVLLLRAHGEAIDWHRAEEIARRFRFLLPLQKGLRYILENFSVDSERLVESKILTGQAAAIEIPLFSVRQGSRRRRCTHREMLALVEHYKPLAQSIPGSGMVLLGGAQPNATREWCVRHKILWFSDYQKKEIVDALKARKFTGGHLIHGNFNGRYSYELPE